jgi:hypothetical protein
MRHIVGLVRTMNLYGECAVSLAGELPNMRSPNMRSCTVYIFGCGYVYTVSLAGKSPNIRSYTVSMCTVLADPTYMFW